MRHAIKVGPTTSRAAASTASYFATHAAPPFHTIHAISKSNPIHTECGTCCALHTFRPSTFMQTSGEALSKATLLKIYHQRWNNNPTLTQAPLTEMYFVYLTECFNALTLTIIHL